jgi:23S rRNA (uridine2552-2'-O)-methyltransferase
MGNKREKPDHYTIRAKKEGFPARSVYKLEEILQKCLILKPGMKVLDIGAAPGSWSLFVLKKLQGKGELIGIDLQSISIQPKQKNYQFITGDFFNTEVQEKLKGLGLYDLILSDAAPATTGNRTIDGARSYQLVDEIIDFSLRILNPKGSLVVKVFQSGDEKKLLEKLKSHFTNIKSLKPKACRKNSFETYFIGLGKK